MTVRYACDLCDAPLDQRIVVVVKSKDGNTVSTEYVKDVCDIHIGAGVDQAWTAASDRPGFYQIVVQKANSVCVW